eukprot:CAMPEP_0172604494 /NCGR_PEP_ID=MMETSP1068-20121228/24754_1 /TAXON_ID=35684 /ORGANISM="Pseudopedinella elastica, Strain CCMP716" /LENGTH=114 /DNA_ID=CAMNT_0013406585 /DNA_START=394 /DNA_END=735 /DNA_ORIENTATION=-
MVRITGRSTRFEWVKKITGVVKVTSTKERARSTATTATTNRSRSPFQQASMGLLSGSSSARAADTPRPRRAPSSPRSSPCPPAASLTRAVEGGAEATDARERDETLRHTRSFPF